MVSKTGAASLPPNRINWFSKFQPEVIPFSVRQISIDTEGYFDGNDYGYRRAITL